MDLEILEIVKNLPIFHKESQALIKAASLEDEEEVEKETEAIAVKLEVEIIPLVEGNKNKFLITYGEVKNLLSIEKGNQKKELDVWLKMTEEQLSFYRPDIYYIDPNFLFTISQFYEGYTSIDKLNLSSVDKGIISSYLLQFNEKFHRITSNKFNIKAIMQTEFIDEIAAFRKENTLGEEEIAIILSFVDQTDFGNIATYNHQELSMENILYNPETKDVKIIHMKHATYGVPVYDYVYMIKAVDKEISRVFLPIIEKVNPKVVQAVSLLCDMKIYHIKKKKNVDTQIDIQNIHAQIGLLKEHLSTFKK